MIWIGSIYFTPTLHPIERHIMQKSISAMILKSSFKHFGLSCCTDKNKPFPIEVFIEVNIKVLCTRVEVNSTHYVRYGNVQMEVSNIKKPTKRNMQKMILKIEIKYACRARLPAPEHF